MSAAGGAWRRYPLLLEINTRVWLHELSARLGRAVRLDTVPEAALEAFARQGFDALWLMGVWTTGEEAVAEARRHAGLWDDYRRALPDVRLEDVVGSPYAISRYEVPPALGGTQGLARLRERLRGLGLRVLLDFVPNHTARDHWMVSVGPEVFVQGTEADLAPEPGAFYRSAGGAVIAHGRDPYFPPWTDTAQVDHASRHGREAMREELLKVAAQCDGVRCDMAMLVLPDVFARTWSRAPAGSGGGFWQEAVPAVRAREPGFLFLAEAYWGLERRLQQEGFDFTYDKELYDRLRAGDAAGVRACLGADGSFQDRCARFVENHDEARAAVAFAGRSGAMAVTFLSPGLRLFHEGQLQGRRVKVPVQLRRRPDEAPNAAAVRCHDVILGLLHGDLFHEGSFEPLAVRSAGEGDRSHERLVASAWWPRGRSSAPAHLVVAHIGEGQACGRIPLTVPRGQWVLLDHADGQRYLREGDEMRAPGLFVVLGPYQVHLFDMFSP